MRTDRRNFLRFAGVSALGVAATACGAKGGAGTPSAPPPALGPPDWEALRAKLSRGLLLPGESGYDKAKRVFNTLFDGRKPAAIATCAKPEDVQACLAAAASRVPIAARGGGHSYAGYSVPDGGLVIDLSGLSDVDVRSDRAVVGAGAKLKDVYAALGKAGRCLPAGTCPSVGISGLTLGGGLGVLTRKYGLTCDHLLSAEVVTADGRVRTASADSEPELFWALRGGGGGNFGIVTSFTFSTVPAPSVTVFSLKFPNGSAASVLGAWQDWIAGAPPELWSNLILTGGSPVACRVGGCFVGSASALNPLLDGLLANTGAPASRTVTPMSYTAAMNYFGNGVSKETFVAASRIMTEPARDPKKLVDMVDGRIDMDLLFDGLGGAVADVAPADTAFWHRKALASVQIHQKTTAQAQSSAVSKVTEVVSGLADAGLDGGYVNYIDPTLPDWMTAYYGDNAARLRKVAKTYDPNKVFAFAQGIPPA